MALQSKPYQWLLALFPFTRRNRERGRVFHSQQDAYSFVRKAYKETGGATDELRKLHEEFKEFKRARENPGIIPLRHVSWRSTVMIDCGKESGWKKIIQTKCLAVAWRKQIPSCLWANGYGIAPSTSYHILQVQA